MIDLKIFPEQTLVLRGASELKALRGWIEGKAQSQQCDHHAVQGMLITIFHSTPFLFFLAPIVQIQQYQGEYAHLEESREEFSLQPLRNGR